MRIGPNSCLFITLMAVMVQIIIGPSYYNNMYKTGYHRGNRKRNGYGHMGYTGYGNNAYGKYGYRHGNTYKTTVVNNVYPMEHRAPLKSFGRQAFLGSLFFGLIILKEVANGGTINVTTLSTCINFFSMFGGYLFGRSLGRNEVGGVAGTGGGIVGGGGTVNGGFGGGGGGFGGDTGDVNGGGMGGGFGGGFP